MASYSQEIKNRARDYFEVHSYKFDKISQLLNVPVSTLSDWKRNGSWIKGCLKDKVNEAKEKLNTTIKDNAIFNEVKDELVAELKAQNPTMLATTVEQDQIIDNRAVAILLEAASIENFDALAMDGVMLANKKLTYMQNLPMKSVSMGEIKTYNDIISGVKTQVYGKAPDTVIQVNQKNMTTEDYSKMTTDDLYKLMDKHNKSEAKDMKIL